MKAMVKQNELHKKKDASIQQYRHEANRALAQKRKLEQQCKDMSSALEAAETRALHATRQYRSTAEEKGAMKKQLQKMSKLQQQLEARKKKDTSIQQ